MAIDLYYTTQATSIECLSSAVTYRDHLYEIVTPRSYLRFGQVVLILVPARILKRLQMISRSVCFHVKDTPKTFCMKRETATPTRNQHRPEDSIKAKRKRVGTKSYVFMGPWSTPSRLGSKNTRMELIFGRGRLATILRGQGLHQLGETLHQFKLQLNALKFISRQGDTNGVILDCMRLFNQCMEDGFDDEQNGEEQIEA
ncbi:hypothetical protein BGX29_001668 [Mortierella sp. GBA35]|nr:hypothetical protein BGX29_001668 [Mortierella sp. GBA35]